MKKMTSMRLQNRTKRMLESQAKLFGSQAEATQLGADIVDLIVKTMAARNLEVNRTSVILFTMQAMNVAQKFINPGENQSEDEGE